MMNLINSSYGAVRAQTKREMTFEKNQSKPVSFKGADEDKPVVKVAINGGCGRIGKTFFREWAATELKAGRGIVAETNPQFEDRIMNSPARLEIVGINVGKRMSEEGLENALKLDTIMGNFPGELKAKREDGKLYLYVGSGENQRKIRILEQRNVVTGPKGEAALPWKELDVDVVVDATGTATNGEKLGKHLEAGAKKAICSAPGKEGLDNTIVYGVNHDKLLPTDKLLSNASCTTTCIAPIIRVLNDKFGVESGFIQTTHSVTATQFTQDKAVEENSDDLAKNRGSFDSIIPTTTGAAKAIGLIIPELNGKLNGLAARVPTNDVSVAYVVLNFEQKVTKDEVKQALREAAQTDKYKDILMAAPKGATSRDMLGRHESSLYVEDQIQVIGDKMAIVPAFYDNEWGYTRSLTDLTRLAGAQLYKPQSGKSQSGNNLKFSA